ncbi:MAG: tripartite tricarboxylate transporter TctB family protein [Candidatus Rokubacteria bacterium]|nr:tripartite tricarboxylate transporter TctB family protein [Candidatus Rokubacteria bacterium]MBI2554822.1 tripartite tricarboxylate transporter TctB family protein [Candidatus Rokubacteria bacterium]
MFTSDRIAGSALVLLAVVTAWETRRLPLGTLHNPGPAYMPLLLALILGSLGLVVALRGGGSPALGALRWPEAGHAVAILAGCAFAALTLERLGYRLTVFVVLAFLLGFVERKRPAVVAAVALGLSFSSYFLFSNLLRVPLPRGPWGL